MWYIDLFVHAPEPITNMVVWSGRACKPPVNREQLQHLRRGIQKLIRRTQQGLPAIFSSI